MPAQDRVRSDQAMATQRPGQPPHQGGEHGPVHPVQARTWVGAAEYGDLVAQHELAVLAGGSCLRQGVQAGLMTGSLGAHSAARNVTEFLQDEGTDHANN